MSADHESSALMGVVGASIAVCCGLPILLGAGIALGAAGLAVGSGFVVAVGAALAVWGRRHRRTRRRGIPSGDDR